MVSLQQKNSFIIPLASFIRFNKKIAGERLANLFGKYFDELLDSEKASRYAHEKFWPSCPKNLFASRDLY